jgi:hypothetical protein
MSPRKQKNGQVVPPSEPLRVANRHEAVIDDHAGVRWVAAPPDHVPPPKCPQADAADAAILPAHVHKFGACTADLELLADWLQTCGISSVAVESISDYRIALFELPEGRGFQVYLVDPRQMP